MKKSKGRVCNFKFSLFIMNSLLQLNSFVPLILKKKFKNIPLPLYYFNWVETFSCYYFNAFWTLYIIYSHHSSQIPNTNTKYQIPNANCAQAKERATNQIQKLQRTKREQITKLKNQNQVVTNLSHYSKLKPTNIK